MTQQSLQCYRQQIKKLGKLEDTDHKLTGVQDHTQADLYRHQNEKQPCLQQIVLTAQYRTLQLASAQDLMGENGLGCKGIW